MDDDFQDLAGSMLLSLWPLKAAITSLMHKKQQTTLQFPDLQN